MESSACECAPHTECSCATRSRHEATDVIIGGGFDELDYSRQAGGLVPDLSTGELIVVLSLLAVIVFGLVLLFR